MPPRYAYWTIIAGGLPTAFRATDREELLPTFQRLREKHPDAVMKWFARGKLWDSPEESRSANTARNDRGDARTDNRQGRSGGRDHRDRDEQPREARDRNWRPGGEHRDPRQKFKDAKKARNLDRRQDKFARKHGVGRDRGEDTRPPREKPHGDALLEPPRRPANGPRDRRFSDRPPFAGSPASGGRDRNSSRQSPSTRYREKPHGDPFRGEIDGSRRSSREPFRDRPRDDRSRGGGHKPEDRNRQHATGGPPKTNWRDRPQERRPSDYRGAKPADRGRQDHWRDRQNTPREKPHGDPLRNDRGGSNFRRDDHRREAAREDRGPQKPDRFRDRPPKADWRGRDAAPKRRPHGDPMQRQPRAPREFKPTGFVRGHGTEEPPAPPRPRGPNREPAPSERPEPAPPPRPNEPSIPPPGPPERGRRNWDKPRRRHDRE